MEEYIAIRSTSNLPIYTNNIYFISITDDSRKKTYNISRLIRLRYNTEKYMGILKGYVNTLDSTFHNSRLIREIVNTNFTFLTLHKI